MGVQSSSIFPTGCGCSWSLGAFPALLPRAELKVMWMEGEELLGHAGGTASLVLELLLSAFKVQVYFFPPSLSLCFKAAELYLDYFPNLLFTALRTCGLFLQER